MWMLLLRGIVAGATVVVVTELARRYPRVGALVLTLPLVSLIAFVASWTKDADLPAISRLARETLILVPLGLPFFVPLAFAETLRLGFWPAFALGVLLAGTTIVAYFYFAGTK
jgi:hypothetical protein